MKYSCDDGIITRLNSCSSAHCCCNPTPPCYVTCNCNYAQSQHVYQKYHLKVKHNNNKVKNSEIINISKVMLVLITSKLNLNLFVIDAKRTDRGKPMSKIKKIYI